MICVWWVSDKLRSVSGSKISYAKLELFLLVAREFTRNLRWLSTGIKWGKRNTCAVKEALAAWLTGNFYGYRAPPREIFDLLTSSHYPYVPFRHLQMLRHHYPFIPFGRLVMKRHHYPLVPCAPCSVNRDLIWFIYTVYFNCKYFISLYFIYARTIRMPPRDFASTKSLRGQ